MSDKNNISFAKGDVVLSKLNDKVYVVLSCYCGFVRCVSLKTMLCNSELPNTYDELFPSDQVLSMQADNRLPGIGAAQTIIENIISNMDRVLRNRLELIEGKSKVD